MTAIKHTLQREVFLPSEERLFSVVHVTKEGKKKKPCFLCTAVTSQKPAQVTLYQVKKSDKSDALKKKTAWPLRQIKLLDAKYIDRDVGDFEIHIDKVYKWVASSVAEKNAFIQSLWKSQQQLLHNQTALESLRLSILPDQVGGTMGGVQGGGPEDDESSNWKALSKKEQSDLELLMSQCDFAISNAELFAGQLTKDLSVLDGANIHSIMGSEDQVIEMMRLLDRGCEEAEQIEKKLREYEIVLETVKDLMDCMKDKDALINIKNKNHRKLLEELEALISKLSLDHTFVKSLLDGDLSTPRGVHECTLAARAILKCHNAEIKPALCKMMAVQDQKKRLTSYKNAFVKRLSHHLNNLFIHQPSSTSSSSSSSHPQQSELKLPTHTSCYKELLPYCELMNWLKIVDVEIFNKLKSVYTTNLSKLFGQQVKDFMNSAKQQLTYKRNNLSANPGSATLSRKLMSANQTSSNSSINKSEGVDRNNAKNSEVNREGEDVFDQIYEQVLTELEVWCVAEQDFCVKFFNLDYTDQQQQLHDDVTNNNNRSSTSDNNSSDSPWVQNVCKMMYELFLSLESELMALEAFGINLNNYNSLCMLVRMSGHVLLTEDVGSFLSKTFATCLVQIKRNFDRFVDSLIQNMRECKTNKKSRLGILQFVHKFEEFARQSEWVFRSTNRRTDLDRAYAKLTSALFTEINRVANESQKSPPEVVHFENYHRIFALLSELKITSLDAVKKEAKKQYQEWMQVYVVAYLGQPLEKVHQFFQGVEARVASGMRMEDVGYQVQFNRQELKRIIKEYSGKEVKKGLELLYKKVDKHLSEEENLLQVVWHSMQDEFIKQYKYIESMINRCYPDSNIYFEFSIEDLLGYFSDIALSH
ncbi:hypothetical protein HELRODRAFT_76461 [Helobdella robusta]|uniref:Exocyst complex component Sec3 PIP2-binding N-terminal domain-containing protein n=1 Tax=Helobdella robusta TaxID=6412 RepID=T1G2K1_HELRO|nr:hypothetical protein HELRODRAFT_76461 [Helobdella robusta]ESO07376.1 hypothetical protein HELRODRAFT_76461 [Helobdella robusta]